MSVPKLRFKTDDGSEFPEWEKNKIGTYLSIRNEKQVPTEEAPLKAFIAYKGVADKGDRYDRSFLVKSEDKQYKRTELNDFIYSSNNLDVGSIGLNTFGTAVISDVYEIFKPKENIFPTVLDAAIQKKAIINAILRFRQGCLYGQYKIYPENFLSVKISMPSLPEQQKIADFFSALNLVIDQTQTEIDAWEKQKRGVMQLLFSQKIRFKADDGSEFPEWKELSFTETFTGLNNNTFSRDSLNGRDGIYKDIHYGDVLIKYGPVLDMNTNNVPFVNSEIDCSKYTSLKDGDIIIADTAEDETVGKTTEIQNIGKHSVVSGLHTMAWRPIKKFASRYLGYYMNSSAYHNQLRPYMQGIKVTSISKANILLTTILYPCLVEQQKIAACLSAFDDVIEKTKRELEAYRELKKGLLQQMFV